MMDDIEQKGTEKQFYTEDVHTKLVRKAKRSKWQRISYYAVNGGHRHGWLVNVTERGVKTIRLVGDLRNIILSIKESGYVKEV